MFSLRSAVVLGAALLAVGGCRDPSRTFSVYSFTIKRPNGEISTTMFSEVSDPSMCNTTAKAAGKGVDAGDPQGNAVQKTALCLSELPAELQKVANGERLSGAYVVKVSNPPALLYSVSRGFPIENPALVCRDLSESMRRHTPGDHVVVSCVPPTEVDMVRASDGPAPKP